ncbi:MAG: hypothetical protein HDT40_07140 [Lachnospiraceae bacterium]|nr:hypothetical protein [Lachnospiraceae bacterium]
MRRRIKICLTILFIILFISLFIPVLALVVVYHSAWAKEINYDSISSSFASWKPTYNKNKDTFMAASCSEDDVFEVELVVKEIKGTINVTIYGGNVKNFDENKTIINSEHEIMRYQLTEIGTQKYSISEKCNCYVVIMELTEGSEYATVEQTTYRWSTNWEILLWKLGLKKGEKSDIDTIRTVIE